MGIFSLFKVLKSINDNIKNAKKYLSMSTDELLALTDEQLYDALNEVLYCNIDIEDFDTINNVQKNISTLFQFDAEIQNGGLCQFFVNSSSDFAPFVEESLSEIGAAKILELFKNFIADNRIDLSDLSSFKISKAEEFEVQNNRYPFDAFDDAYYDIYEDENLEVLLTTYARKHIDEVFAGLK